MKSSIIHIMTQCLAALALSVMASCGSQEESLPEVGNGYIAVFTLDMRNEAPRESTRTTSADGEYESGSGLENFIDFSPKNFRCLLFGTDNIFIDTLEAVSVQSLEEQYILRLRLKETEEVKNALTEGCRFVFMVNWDTDAEPAAGTTIEQLCASASAEFGFSQHKTVLSPTNLIPMYGVKEFENGVPDFKDGKEISDLGVVRILRALAKIDVNVRFIDFAETPEVTSVSLTHSNSKGYKAPANITKEEQYVTGSWLTDYTPVHIPGDATDMALELTKDESTGHYIAYVPEHRNVDDVKKPLDSRSRIKISFKADGIDFDGYVDFCHTDPSPAGVSPGQHFDIARNNWYKFDVSVKCRNLYWKVDVVPYTSVVLNPDFGLEITN